MSEGYSREVAMPAAVLLESSGNAAHSRAVGHPTKASGIFTQILWRVLYGSTNQGAPRS